MTKTWFVTGTDTEVGKTAVSCALLAGFAAQGLRTAAIKPVAAGCDELGYNEDALALAEHISVPMSYQQLNPVALKQAIAPHIAAKNEARRLTAASIAGYCRGVMSLAADVVLIEGAGGWRVPINERETLADVATELQKPVILVVGMRLGCINHALLTAEAIRRDGLHISGWVANQCAGTMPEYEENLASLVSRMGAPLLGELPYIVPFDGKSMHSYLDFEQLG